MSRPGDWHVVDLGSDPTPGDAWGVRALSSSYGRVVQVADDVARIANAVESTSGSGIWVGKAGDAFRAKLETMPDDARKCADSYTIARDAMTLWASRLEDAQGRADSGLAQARVAQADLDAANAALSAALADQSSTQSTLDRYDRIERQYRDIEPPAGTWVPTAWQLRQARNANSTADSAVSSAGSSQSAAQARLDAAKRLVQEAKGDYESSARTIVSKLDNAKTAAVRSDNWWEAIYHSDAWGVIVAVVTVVVIVAAVVLSGGAALAVLAIGGALLLADTLMAYAEGDIGEGELFLAVALSAVPGGRGALAAGRVATTGARAAQAANGFSTVGGVAARITGTASRIRTGSDGVTEILFRAKPGWTPEQVQAAIRKVEQVNERNPIVSAVGPDARRPGARSLWDRMGWERPRGYDVDHILDLRLGGENVLENLQLLDRSVNRSFGAQIGNAIRHGQIDIETPVRIYFG